STNFAEFQHKNEQENCVELGNGKLNLFLDKTFIYLLFKFLILSPECKFTQKFNNLQCGLLASPVKKLKTPNVVKVLYSISKFILHYSPLL
ncbi:hypothetical protein MQA17_25555, partial [Escherichia coli]|nr:hypothetical protein [Escherichia coli]